MRVTFTCEKCGHEVFVSSWVRARDGDTLMQTPPNTECPNCAKLTYGPLTEEMVAGALREADKPFRDGGAYIGMARFVLRSLIDGGLADDKPTVTPTCTAKDWRDWLLDLARQK